MRIFLLLSPCPLQMSPMTRNRRSLLAPLNRKKPHLHHQPWAVNYGVNTWIFVDVGCRGLVVPFTSPPTATRHHHLVYPSPCDPKRQYLLHSTLPHSNSLNSDSVSIVGGPGQIREIWKHKEMHDGRQLQGVTPWRGWGWVCGVAGGEERMQACLRGCPGAARLGSAPRPRSERLWTPIPAPRCALPQ